MLMLTLMYVTALAGHFSICLISSKMELNDISFMYGQDTASSYVTQLTSCVRIPTDWMESDSGVILIK